MSSIKNVKFLGKYKIVDPVNLYGCILDNNVFIGPFTEIQSNVYVGKNSRIQSHSFVCSNTEIGKECFIGHGVIFTNDKFKENRLEKDPKKFQKTNIGDNVLIGSNATILPVNICSNVVIGAGSVVTKDIIEPGIYYGNPCKKK
jgi:acetyltransferase-like isoleucine patch superfamily enzyme